MNLITYYRQVVLILFLALTGPGLPAQNNSDYLLLDGVEPLYTAGLDSSGHWWAMTKPFTNQYRLYVDGESSLSYREITKPVFSPDGNRWACFARDAVQWYVIANDTIISLPGTGYGELRFSPNSRFLVYSYKETGDEHIVWKGRTIRVYQRYGRFYLSWNADKLAFMGRRGGGVVLNVNGVESPVYDEIRPFGFWYDGRMVFAGRNGPSWQVYKGDFAISEFYRDITGTALNIEGTVGAFTAVQISIGSVGVLISDEYFEPLVSRQYAAARNIVLHPRLPMMAFNAVYEGRDIVVLNSSEYYGGDITGKPEFTCDGTELIFTGCAFDCFASVNGKRYPIYTGISPDAAFAMKPKSRTIAYVTSSTLVVKYLDRKELYAGMMVDYTMNPRYNWREDRYEALGVINQKLYLLTIRI